ncbi:hemerythrin family protein [Duganella sp. FT3S]|uniref:Hemerythrin family protein n=1 Tax=Rugamonas fusca TaxID=2758568 RepID=A0A7W2EDR3_9BURK|nr:hemerythrin family protein [Rugamonas fusca]MBA5603971.1 hemerythrin family protein [Rugamonas fusca]
MEEPIWTPDMALGVPLMDDAHQALAQQISALQHMPEAGDFDAGLARLTEALEADFRAEEELMEAINYPAIRSHREQHARVLGTLHSLEGGDHASRRRAVELLLPWFHVHLETADTALAAALQVAGVRFDTGPEPTSGRPA